MKNKGPDQAGLRDRMERGSFGPEPGAAAEGHLSRSRANLLRILRAQPVPTSLAALSLASGLHPNTIREHLDALMTDGLVVRTAEPTSGRGRPAWLYAAGDTPPPNEYARLATALAAALHDHSAHPVEDATRAGRDWGSELARERGERASSPTAARRDVVEILDRLGFDPEADRRAARVRLTRCPLLEAARKYPDVVCAVHLGLTQGALDELGADPDGASLVPFAEPGACVLHLMSRARPESRS